jgi:ADP-ribose pyrophosphatase YjhB (NUDIX family)
MMCARPTHSPVRQRESHVTAAPVTQNFASHGHNPTSKLLWADDPNVAKKELKLRKTWVPTYNLFGKTFKPVTLQDAGVSFDASGCPVNRFAPKDAMNGRNFLGKYGPNHAADPIITRAGVPGGPPRVLAIRRKDTGQLAFPGGMVDAGEVASDALAREMVEEAGAAFTAIAATMKRCGRVIFAGHVKDPRETRHAWIESYAVHLHIDEETANSIRLEDSLDVDVIGKPVWMEASKANVDAMYGDHARLLRLAIRKQERVRMCALAYSFIGMLVAIFSVALIARDADSFREFVEMAD